MLEPVLALTLELAFPAVGALHGLACMPSSCGLASSMAVRAPGLRATCRLLEVTFMWKAWEAWSTGLVPERAVDPQVQGIMLHMVEFDRRTSSNLLASRAM